MPHRYRAYQLDKEGRVIGLPEILNCDTEEMAIERAKQLAAVGNDVEVWQGGRLVTRIQAQLNAKHSSADR